MNHNGGNSGRAKTLADVNPDVPRTCPEGVIPDNGLRATMSPRALEAVKRFKLRTTRPDADKIAARLVAQQFGLDGNDTSNVNGKLEAGNG